MFGEKSEADEDIERRSNFVNNEALSDITFVVGLRRIRSHRIILSLESEVFNTMFNGTLPEQGGEIHVTDVRPEIFLSMLSYIYCKDVVINGENVWHLYHVADKYAVYGLKQCCSRFLLQQMDVDNVLDILQQAMYFDDKGVIHNCFQFVDKNISFIMKIKQWNLIDRKLLCEILKRNTLKVKEVELFRGIVQWAKMSCENNCFEKSKTNMRIILGEALYLIRFPTMKHHEIMIEILPSELLDATETDDILTYFKTGRKSSSIFNSLPRCINTYSHKITNENNFFNTICLGQTQLENRISITF